MKKPTPNDVYEAYKYSLQNGKYACVYGKIGTVVLLDLYKALRQKFRKLTINEFHVLITQANESWPDWGGYVVTLGRGTITGIMCKPRSEQKYIHPQNFKFFKMKLKDSK